MNKAQILHYFPPISIILITIYSMLPYPKENINILNYINITFVWWIISFLILYGFYVFRNVSGRQKISDFKLVEIYLLWNVLQCIRGIIIAETYWDFKALIANGTALLIPLVVYTTANIEALQLLLRVYVKYALPLFFIFAFLIDKGAYGFYLVPISFLIFFIPVINIRWKIVIIFFTLIVLLADITARSNVIKFAVPVILLSFNLLGNKLNIKIIEFVRKLFFIMPILLLFLAVTGVFNVFDMDSYVSDSYVESKIDSNGEIVEEDLMADTRTLLYVEVLQTAEKYDSWIFGRSPARGNETNLFGDTQEKITGRKERSYNEVSILNIFTWTGFIGVILYMAIFYKASSLAINQSNNIFSKMIGLYLAFRWMYGWVEDINNFSLTYMFVWVFIGFCFSSSFRNMTNEDIRNWVRGIFYEKYKYDLISSLYPENDNINEEDCNTSNLS